MYNDGVKEGLSRGQRVEFLFNQIQKNATADQAYAALEKYEVSVSRKKRSESGFESERNVMHALYELPIVDTIVRSKQFSPEDMQGIDLTVQLLDAMIQSVDVQVKSNKADVRKFRDFAPHSKTFRPDGADILARRGLVVLNGQDRLEVIQEHFMEGLDRIRSVREQGSRVA